MKKLLIILLPVTLFLVSCGGGEGDLQPVTQTLEETIVGKKWCVKTKKVKRQVSHSLELNKQLQNFFFIQI